MAGGGVEDHLIATDSEAKGLVEVNTAKRGFIDGLVDCRLIDRKWGRGRATVLVDKHTNNTPEK